MDSATEQCYKEIRMGGEGSFECHPFFPLSLWKLLDSYCSLYSIARKFSNKFLVKINCQSVPARTIAFYWCH